MVKGVKANITQYFFNSDQLNVLQHTAQRNTPLNLIVNCCNNIRASDWHFGPKISEIHSTTGSTVYSVKMCWKEQNTH